MKTGLIPFIGFMLLSVISFSLSAQQVNSPPPGILPAELQKNISQTQAQNTAKNLPRPPQGVLPAELQKSSTSSTTSSTLQMLTDVSKPIHITSNQQTLVLRLKSNPTTGYSWFLKSYDKDLLKLQSHHFIATSTPLAGAPGVEEWIFYIEPYAFVAPQLSEIHLTYARPWDLSGAKDVAVQWMS